MACISMATVPSNSLVFRSTKEDTFRTLHNPFHISGSTKSFSIHYRKCDKFTRLLFSDGKGLRCSSQIMHAVRNTSGLEASTSSKDDVAIHLNSAKVVVESRDDDQIQVRVDLTGKETQKVFDVVLTNLARSAPPVPGFRKSKGGKTSNVPKDFLLRALGEDRVTKFVIQEIVSLTLDQYVKEENLTVNKKFHTTQSAEELKLLFSPGNEFGFNARLEIEKSNTELTSSSPSEPDVLPQ